MSYDSLSFVVLELLCITVQDSSSAGVLASQSALVSARICLDLPYLV